MRIARSDLQEEARHSTVLREYPPPPPAVSNNQQCFVAEPDPDGSCALFSNQKVPRNRGSVKHMVK